MEQRTHLDSLNFREGVIETSNYLILIAALTMAQTADADAYKCMKNGRTTYQATPCATEAPDAGKVKIKAPSAEQEATAKQKLKAIEAHNSVHKENQEKADREQFEKNVKLSNIDEQRRQADALEKEAKKPPVSIFIGR
ncbi:MAG: hypothetical protein LUQ11_12925 [Methylococcaceae bacterium]|nr:hypothetical protein [Methylococcaceae bacterium]